KSTDDYRPQTIEVLPNPALSPLFQAVVEATEEAIYNSLLKAKTMTGYKGRKVEAIPIDKVMEILKKYNVLNYDKKFKLR
ncbi:Peptidase family S58, partial [Candidatus Kryptonium thompsonii]